MKEFFSSDVILRFIDDIVMDDQKCLFIEIDKKIYLRFFKINLRKDYWTVTKK